MSFRIENVIKFPGDNGGGETPVPIPNTAVKPSCADGTAVYPWKSRTLPGLIYFLTNIASLSYSANTSTFSMISINL